MGRLAVRRLSSLSDDERARILERSTAAIFDDELRQSVATIVEDVRREGDVAVSRALAAPARWYRDRPGGPRRCRGTRPRKRLPCKRPRRDRGGCVRHSLGPAREPRRRAWQPCRRGGSDCGPSPWMLDRDALRPIR